MEYSIGDSIEVTVGNKKYNGLILDIKDSNIKGRLEELL